MKRQLISSFFAIALLHAAAQQLPQLSQYAFNDYVYNAGVAGSRDLFELRSGHRYQWTGIVDAPRTFTLTATTPVGRNMGVGGLLYTDHVGPTRRTGFLLSYAYHLRLTENIKLAFAASGGLTQFLIDGSKIHFHDGTDPVMDDQLRGEVLPDASLAFYLYHANWWAGVSAPQILNSTVYFIDGVGSLSTLSRHYFITGGYRLHLSDDFSLEPQVLVKYVDPVPAKVDLTALIKYQDRLWLGATYRTNDAISLMFGVWLKEMFQFGYAYDITTTNLSAYSGGTHELTLALTFAKHKPRPPAPPAE